VINCKPGVAIEFGVLDGYSTFWIAMGLRYGFGTGHLTSYDLWDDYPYKHGSIDQVQAMLKRNELDEHVTLAHGNFFDFLKNPTPFDFLHIDISNDGDIIEQAIEALLPDIMDGAMIMFEGGSEERDQEPWMLEYGRRPIRDIKFPFKVVNPKWPSISRIDRKILTNED
jgi:predicted O-methyltransferase YrrM